MIGGRPPGMGRPNMSSLQVARPSDGETFFRAFPAGANKNALMRNLANEPRQSLGLLMA